MQQNTIKLIECSRDAMQGWKHLISTKHKIDYINKLLAVGFHTLDCGSFVSAKAIPQMADTAEVMQHINTTATHTKLLAIVANQRGAEEALAFEKIAYLGFPFSVSPTFQQRNTNSTISQSLKTVEAIQQLCIQHGRQLVVYLSMGFGNPYGDAYNEQIVFEWAAKIASTGISIISVADTVGVATAQQVHNITKHLITQLPQTEIGVHLHSTSANWHTKLDAAIKAGCKRFDGALRGIGGCPMANDELVGNMDTALMIPHFELKKIMPVYNKQALAISLQTADVIFS
jgi:hydroxymethylglutaryl-CoA lyase